MYENFLKKFTCCWFFYFYFFTALVIIVVIVCCEVFFFSSVWNNPKNDRANWNGLNGFVFILSLWNGCCCFLVLKVWRLFPIANFQIQCQFWEEKPTFFFSFILLFGWNMPTEKWTKNYFDETEEKQKKKISFAHYVIHIRQWDGMCKKH